MKKHIEKQIRDNIAASCILSGHKKRSKEELKKIRVAAKMLNGII